MLAQLNRNKVFHPRHYTLSQTRHCIQAELGCTLWSLCALEIFIPLYWTKEFAAVSKKQASHWMFLWWNVVVLEWRSRASQRLWKCTLPQGKYVFIFPLHPCIYSLVESIKGLSWKAKAKKSLWEIRHLKFKVSRRSSQLPAEPRPDSLHPRSKIKASTQPGFFHKQPCDPLSMLVLTKDSNKEPGSHPHRTGALSGRESSNKSPWIWKLSLEML